MHRRIAITGGMGAGKSLLASWLRQAGHWVVDADLEGRQVLVEEGALVQELARHFGSRILDAHGAVDRRRLARQAFATDETLRTLNAQVFPYLHRRLLQRLQEGEEALAQRADLALFLDAALVLEWGIQEAFHEIWLVRAPQDQRVARAASRLGLTEEETRERMARQWPQEALARHAHLVLENDGDPDLLLARLCEALGRRNLALPPRN